MNDLVAPKAGMTVAFPACMKPLFASAGLLGLALCACSGSGFDDGGGGENQDEGGAIESGAYFAMTLPSKDTCGFTNGEPIELLPVDVTVSDGGKTLAFDQDETPVRCTLDGKDRYRCAVEIEEGDSDDQTFASEILLQRTAPGILEGTIKVTVSCEGEFCGEDEDVTFPCEVSGQFALTRAMPTDFAPTVGAYDVAVGQPVTTTCDVAPPIAAQQRVTIEAKDDGTANVIPDGDPTPHECAFEGRGRATCQRTTQTETTESFAQIDAVWTGATSFQGIAGVEISCREGDCADSELGELPCTALYFIEGAAAAAK